MLHIYMVLNKLVRDKNLYIQQRFRNDNVYYDVVYKYM